VHQSYDPRLNKTAAGHSGGNSKWRKPFTDVPDGSSRSARSTSVGLAVRVTADVLDWSSGRDDQDGAGFRVGLPTRDASVDRMSLRAPRGERSRRNSGRIVGSPAARPLVPEGRTPNCCVEVHPVLRVFVAVAGGRQIEGAGLEDRVVPGQPGRRGLRTSWHGHCDNRGTARAPGHRSSWGGTGGSWDGERHTPFARLSWGTGKSGRAVVGSGR
jgi:hypothetical protein